MKSDLIDIEVIVKHETPKAVLVSDGDRDVWLPLSQVDVVHTDRSKATVSLPEWLAIEKELV